MSRKDFISNTVVLTSILQCSSYWWYWSAWY